MKVYIATDGIWCSEKCVLEDPRNDGKKPAGLAGRSFPDPRRASAIVEILLYRATCDTCNLNLIDLFALGEEGRRRREARGRG